MIQILLMPVALLAALLLLEVSIRAACLLIAGALYVLVKAHEHHASMLAEYK